MQKKNHDKETTCSGVLVKFIRDDIVNGEDNLDVVLLCLFDETRNLVGTRLVKERVADLK